MNLAKLNGIIIEKSKAEHLNAKKLIAAALGISIQALGKKLNGQSKITTDDAQIMADILNLNYSERVEIFLPMPSQK